MEEILDENKQINQLTDKEIFTKIWYSPREVFRYINEYHYDKYVTQLLVFSGITRAFNRAQMQNMGDHMSIWGILGFCIIIGGLMGWITYYLYVGLISWTGKWLNGQGNVTSILRIISYAMIPSIIALFLLIPQVAVYGAEIFKENGDITSAGLYLNVFVYSIMALELVLGIWTIVLCVVGISEVQNFSIGKSILNLILPLLVIFIPILLILFLVKLF